MALSLWRKSVVLVCVLFASVAWAAGSMPSGPVEANPTSADVAALAAYILLALVFSFMCSVAEAVLLSLTPSYIVGLEGTNPKLAALLKALKQDNVDQSLAAILTLNTIAHTVGAIGSGAKATVVFGSAWFGVFSVVMTLLILFLSEIVPKTLGAVYWTSLAWPTAMFIRGLIVVLYPLIWVSEKLTRLIAEGKGHHGFNRDEFIAMARLGAQSGQLDEKETRIIRNLFRLGSLRTADVMTPSVVIQALRQDSTVSEALESESHRPFSRLPIYDGTLDRVTGFVLKLDLLLAKAEGKAEEPVSSLRRDITTLPEDLPLRDLLDHLLDHREHIALVLGEYGETRGLVTLEDAVETLLGLEIVDEMDKVDDMRLLARQRWQKRAKALGLNVDAVRGGDGGGA